MTPPINSPAADLEFDDSSADAVDTAMGILADRNRRAVLRYLDRSDGTATLTELAEAIATDTRNPDPTTISDLADVSSRDVREVRISLHHLHVPKLDAAGAIDYDRKTETLTLLDQGRTLLERQEAVRGPLR
ncbi:hypothetical protein Htur_1979 [Haloterrigena turkmenica DSM 5511]|uniref:DUF7344 domain-containing protein n=1 Tax=Haloterrigena turkmenica (strain ATCC 51198 / DSM 5511 / JCM 9101 / NCIMB 13204 / VKM B-1734 / 4k) TaxID=543526 RepID=D2RSY3_HALTV|nr:hypothetical protein [Haloterrigena turkmenica]ADB60863.1 hypothetical protein Htur_1979 [Haloterrigena turkmenica DSM 5511]